MPAIVKSYHQTFRRHNDPTSGTRKECWGAQTTDGLWSIERIEMPGTPWVVVHRHFGLEVAMFSTLARACEFLDDRDRVSAAFAEAFEHKARFTAELVLIRRAGGRDDFPDETPEWLREAALAVLEAVAA